MSSQIKLRRGTTAQHSTFTGAEGEVTVDTDKDTLVVHDGSTAGGHEVMKADASNYDGSTIASFRSTGIDDNASSTALTIDASGNVCANTFKNLAGTGAPDFPNGLTLAGNTITGNVTGVTLDDYEEGTWSPQYADAESGGNQSSGAGGGELAIYTKIGRVVHLQLHAVNVNITGLTSGNDFYIRNLPFNSNSTVFYRAPGSVSLAAITNSGTNLSTELSNGKSAFRISETISGGAIDYITVSEIPNGNNQIQISITYFT